MSKKFDKITKLIDILLFIFLVFFAVVLGFTYKKYWLMLVGVFVLCFLFLCFRAVVFNISKTILYGIKDLYNYIRYAEYRTTKKAELVCFAGLMGRGKTIDVVHHMRFLFWKYNNKRVYCRERKKWVTQKVLVLSNVTLNDIPYEHLDSLSQIVSFTDRQKEIDFENDTLTLCAVIIDEASVQLNSRNFKDNIDANFLNTLLTCRHYHIVGIYLTSQRFKMYDALMRDVTMYVIECRKIWRFQTEKYYDAWEVENATNLSLIKPLKRKVWFICDDDYRAYNTYAVVSSLKKSCKDGDMLSEEEILALRSSGVANMDVITNTSRKYRWKQKRENRKFL